MCKRLEEKKARDARSREGRHVPRSAPSAPCLAGGEINVGTHRVPSMPVWMLTYALSMREQETTDLQTFKDVRAVVKARARWVEVERSIRFNMRRGPSAVWRKVHVEHMVCRDLSKLSGCRDGKS